MLSFNISMDGINAQRLKSDNRMPGFTAAVSPLAASRNLHKTVGDPKISLNLEPRTRIEERRFKERRRRLERRKRHDHTLLDTRVQHERRLLLQRIINRQNNTNVRTRGIDVVA